ncbi:3-dehydroquinate synthase [Thermaerobacter sp. FW80]|uniref:3-dehydroquinate synthase n=1 Tax=Thermaerobacter sp. FW80 TaxID=2546351 RepID=UPI001FA955EC|nr:3-dehydroquinate synthase [Thermaerobacter sp. FW80]
MTAPPALRVVLVGMMGAGKTTVGRALAARMGWAFLDLDDLIEQETGETVAALFAREGEPGFRAREERALATALSLERVVIAAGGGVVLSPRNRDRLAREPWVFWLEAPPEELARRLRGAGAARRPLLAAAPREGGAVRGERGAVGPADGAARGESADAGPAGGDAGSAGAARAEGGDPMPAGAAASPAPAASSPRGPRGSPTDDLAARLAALLGQRAPLYAAVARHRVPTAGWAPEAVACAIHRRLPAVPRSPGAPRHRPTPSVTPAAPDLVVEAGAARYPVWVRPGTVGPGGAADLVPLVAAVAGTGSDGSRDASPGLAGSSDPPVAAVPGAAARPGRAGSRPPQDAAPLVACRADPEPRPGSAERPPVALLVSDPVVASLYGHGVAAALEAVGFRVARAVVPAGEEAKSLAWASALYDRLVEAGAGRDAWVFALGGGVVGDLAGFVAATYMRGIAFAQLPTTLLAQVDASAGGKVAVNHPRAKNLIGAFHQPRLVVADPATLATQPWPAYRGGLAEMVKHALLDGDPHLAALEAAVPQLLDRDPQQLAPLIARSVAVKARVVARDPEERGPRAVLNLGHTVAHALEAAAGYRVPHGDAVAAGLAVELELASRLGMAPPALADRVRSLLGRLDLPLTLAEACRAWEVPPPDPEAVLARLRYDKKNRRGRVRFALLAGPGEVTLRDDVPAALVEELVRRSLAGASRV